MKSQTLANLDALLADMDTILAETDLASSHEQEMTQPHQAPELAVATVGTIDRALRVLGAGRPTVELLVQSPVWVLADGEEAAQQRSVADADLQARGMWAPDLVKLAGASGHENLSYTFHCLGAAMVGKVRAVFMHKEVADHTEKLFDKQTEKWVYPTFHQYLAFNGAATSAEMLDVRLGVFNTTTLRAHTIYDAALKAGRFAR